MKVGQSIHKIFAHGNIRSRILKALIGVASLSLISFALISLDGMRRLGNYSVKSSTGLGQDALKISKSALETLTQDGLLRITIDRANMCNSEFKEVEGSVNVLADIGEKLWNNPAAYPKNRSYSFTEQPKDPKLCSVYQYPAGVVLKRIKNDLELSSAMDFFFEPFIANNSNISDFNLATPEGLFRRFPWGTVSPDYDVRKREWFKRAIETGEAGWSAPYIGVIAKNLRINYSKPIYRKKKLVAVVAINVLLKTINERIISTRLNNLGSAVLVDRNLNIIAREGMSTNAENWADPQKIERFSLDAASGSQNKFEEELKVGKAGIHRAAYKGKDCFIAHAQVETTGWSVLFIMPVEAVFAPIIPTEKAITKQVDTVKSQVISKIRFSLFILTIVFFIIIAAVYIVARRTAKLVTDPIILLDKGARIIGNGNLDHRIEIHSGDEIEALADTFNKMTADLKDYIKNLTETTAAKERIQSELNVATDIQASLLPRLFPAFPDRPEFDIFASMDAAKEVGGDFYDFFFIDQNNLCFLIADVAGKGVPAALYMMVAKTLLKSEGQRLGEPDQILSYVNNVLASDNDSCMFATVFCAIMDIRSGEVRFANAGHNPPLVIDSQGIRYLTLKSGFVLGPMEDTEYETERLTLKPGDTLFLYTDGVTEATNFADELYGEPQLLAALQSGPKGELTDMIHNIRAEVTRHANGAPQSDDVTMVALKYHGVLKNG
jgi:sigma-B regulation protein RsbU (phosphoserine phosphatase)